MKKKQTMFFGIAVLLMSAIFTLGGCDTGVNSEGTGVQTLYTPRYQTVPYAQIAGARAAGSGADYELMLSAYDDSHYYYVLYLGYIDRVPILFRDAVLWSGTPANGLSVGFSKDEATEEMVSNSITTAAEQSISKSTETSYSGTVGGELSSEGGFLGIAKVGWKVSVEATVSRATTWGSSSTQSRANTIETATAKSTGTTDSLEFSVTGDDPYGKYRYTLFGTTDVYLVLQTNKTKLTMADITDGYISFCGRPDTYAWGVDYDPDENGTFKKNIDSSLLELPPNLDLSSLEIPDTPVEQVQIPKPAAPTAHPPAGSYTGAIDITLSSANADSQIYYTTNGAEPTAGSTLYTGPVKIPNTCTLKAIAIREGSPLSDIMTETYTITPGRETAWYTGEYNLSRSSGGTVTKVQGDSEMDSKTGKAIYWDIDVTLQPSGNNVVASFTYNVREEGSGSKTTTLKLTQDVTIPLNRASISVDYPYDNYHKTGSYIGRQHDWIVVTPESPVGGPLYKLWVKVDGPNNDEGNIAVRVWLGFNYTYQP
jgi:hypothetical protein